jgi:hypothetical protein
MLMPILVDRFRCFPWYLQTNAGLSVLKNPEVSKSMEQNLIQKLVLGLLVKKYMAFCVAAFKRSCH